MRALARAPLGRIGHVGFDPAAIQLITRTFGDAYLDLSFGAHRAPAALTLMVTPTVPVGEHLTVFGEADNVLRAHCRAVPYAVATILLALGELTGRRVRCGFPWPSRTRPVALAVVALGHGRAAQVRSLLRRFESDPRRRPVIHLGD